MGYDRVAIGVQRLPREDCAGVPVAAVVAGRPGADSPGETATLGLSSFAVRPTSQGMGVSLRRCLGRARWTRLADGQKWLQFPAGMDG
eukprot:2569224-Pyramimonas_sp.AAC.1